MSTVPCGPRKETGMSDVCVEDGCTKGRASGHALYRVSPKGELFEGKCEHHYAGPTDPIVQEIQKQNLDAHDQVRRLEALAADFEADDSYPYPGVEVAEHIRAALAGDLDTRGARDIKPDPGIAEGTPQ